MDYIKLLRPLSHHAASSYYYCARSAVALSTALLLGLSVGAHAAVLKINDNVINLSGELSASVKHTADGMEIDIPGVEITLDCDTAADPDNCTVTIGSGTGYTVSGTGSSGSASSSSGSGSGSSSGSGSGSSSGSGSGSASDDDADCDPALDFGCGDSYSTDDSSGGGDSSGDSGGSTGYTTGTTSGSSADDPCSGTGYNPACNTNSGGSTTAPGAFPTGSARKVDDWSGRVDFGSAKPSAKTKLSVGDGVVTVVGLTMGTGDSPSSGRISFSQVTNVKVPFRAWISTAPDGDRVGACSYRGYSEALFGFTIGGTNACDLSPGGKYYFNMAFCNSTDNDLYCKDSGATSAGTAAEMKLSVGYSD